jgi:hypothetical protein
VEFIANIEIHIADFLKRHFVLIPHTMTCIAYECWRPSEHEVTKPCDLPTIGQKSIQQLFELISVSERSAEGKRHKTIRQTIQLIGVIVWYRSYAGTGFGRSDGPSI